MTLRMVKHFTTRRFDLPIDTSTDTYALDLGINGSCIKPRSFFNLTPGGTLNQELNYLDYDEFLRKYPDPSILVNTPGAPMQWILLPLERSEDPVNGTNTPPTTAPIQRVRIFPYPDAQYNLQYRAQILPYPLTQSTDVILWPAEYEHCLWIWSWGQVERALGEGKEGTLEQLARQAVQDVHLIAGVPDDARRAVRTMRPLSGAMWPPGKYTGWVSSPPG